MTLALCRFAIFFAAVATFVVPAILRADDAAEFVASANKHFACQETDAALADCNKALKLDPKSAEAYDTRARIYNDRHEYDKALADCDKALALDPKQVDAYLDRGNVMSRRGDCDAAIATYERALEIAPNDCRTLNDIGVAHWMQSQKMNSQASAAMAAGDTATSVACQHISAAQREKAMSFWRHGLEVCPTADLRSNLGFAFSDMGDFDSAETHLTAAVALKPGAARPHNNLGRLQLRKSQLRETAARELEPKAKSDPGLATRVKQLHDEAETLRDQAVEQFSKAVELEPTLLEARLNLGQVYLVAKDLKKAEEQYRAILKMQSGKVQDWGSDANFSQAWCGLANVAVARQDLAEAKRDLNNAIKLNPHNVAGFLTLSELRYKTGDYDGGKNSLSSALALSPPARRCMCAEQLAKRLTEAGRQDASAKVLIDAAEINSATKNSTPPDAQQERSK